MRLHSVKPTMAVLCAVVSIGAGVGETARAQSGDNKWHIGGRVVDCDLGRPLSNCWVTFQALRATGDPLHHAWLDWEDPLPVTTGADGRFDVAVPRIPGRCYGDGYPPSLNVTVRGEALVASHLSVPFSRSFSSAPHDFGDVSMRPGRPLALQVVDPTGAPIEGARVRIQRSVPSEWSGFAITGMDGRPQTQMLAPAGEYQVAVEGRTIRGEPSFAVAAQGGSLHRVVVERNESTTLSGSVIDDRGRPVAETRLRVEAHCNDGVYLLECVTTAEGKFRFVPPGSSSGGVRIEMGADDSYWPTIAEARWGEEGVLITVPRRVAARFHVVVPDACDVRRVAVHLIPADPRLRSIMRRVVPLVNGHASVDGVAVGEYRVLVHALGAGVWPSMWQACRIEEGASTEIRFPRMVSQAVVVLADGGQPVAGATIEIALAPADVVRDAVDGHGLGHPCYAWSMAANSIGADEEMVRVASPVRTDASGRATLHAPATDVEVALRITGSSLLASEHRLPNFVGGHAPIRVSVAEAGLVVASFPTDALRGELCAAAPELRARAMEHGDATDPWKRSLGNLLETCGTGLLLRSRVKGGPEYFVASRGHDEFGWSSVEPGAYELCLLVRVRRQHGVDSELLTPSLASLEVVAGKTSRVEPRLLPEHLARLRELGVVGEAIPRPR